MSMYERSYEYVRNEDAPQLAAPPATVGLQGWLRANLFSSVFNSILTLLFAAFAVWVIWGVARFALVNAVWTGSDREACLGEGIGACWPMVVAKMPQWLYGFYPFEARWRVNLAFLAFAIGIVPMLIPRVPYKLWNALYLLIAVPLIAMVLLTGGNFNFGLSGYVTVVLSVLLLSTILPLMAFGIEDGINRNGLGLLLALVAIVLWFSSFALPKWPVTIGDYTFGGVELAADVLSLFAGLVSAVVLLTDDKRRGLFPLLGFLGVVAVLLLGMLILDIDFGLIPVETQKWGGLMVTLVVAITGITASLPLGILLALGRRSKMPVVRLLSVIFIEVIRGVPLITVLFMASVMLPLFLPPGTSFDKLLRALVGVALFSSAYMAEVVRGGLQAIPRGQYEGAMAVGLSYWQMMVKIILPQALKVSIPNIVGNFISLFKDTTLVLIIGLYDLLGIVQASLRDPQWASPVAAPTGYLTVGLMFWVFCFAMSRYSMYTERRLNTGHKR